MFVGISKIELLFPGCRSLKEKRSQLLSIKDKIKRKFNISLAEVDNHELWQRATLGLAVVTDSPSSVNSIIQEIEKLIYKENTAEIISRNIEILTPDE